MDQYFSPTNTRVVQQVDNSPVLRRLYRVVYDDVSAKCVEVM